MERHCLKKPTVVVAGYAAWAKALVNPASQIVAALKNTQLQSCHLKCIEVPVDTEALYTLLERSIEEHSPDIWIGVGVAVSSPAIRLESVGINVRCFDVPDIHGRTLEPTSVVDGGPVAYQSNFQYASVLQELKSHGIPAITSFHAGTHLCNQMLYSVLHLSAQKNLELLSGFVHVPQSAENVAQANGASALGSSMSLVMMTKAIELCVESVVQEYVHSNNGSKIE